MPSPSIAAILPTFNEIEVLRSAVKSLLDQEYENLSILVINAGTPLPPDLKMSVEEISVSSDHFWTASIKVGFDLIRARNYDYVLLANADATLIPGSIKSLMRVAELPNTIAACPGYIQLSDKRIKLLYSHERFYPFLFHARIQRKWSSLTDAPSEPIETPVVGGQGVMFRAGLLKEFDVDPEHFPQAKGDHDLWLSMRSKGIRILVVPTAGAINLRAFGAMQRLSKKKRLMKLWSRATAPTSNDSWQVMWHLRKKHQSLAGAVVSFSIMYPWRLIKGLVDALQDSKGAIDESTTA